MTNFDIRAYRDRSDLAPLLHFASRAVETRLPLAATWHPGDVVWELKPDYDRAHGVRMWLVSGEVVAVSMFMAPGQLWLETLPEGERLVPEILARSEKARAGAALSVRAFESDAIRVTTLERCGYLRGEPEGVWFRFDLSRPIPQVQPPKGYRLRDSIGVDPQRRAQAHRDAWNDLRHLGIDAKSGFSDEMYRTLAAAPVYDRALDMLVEAEDGTYVANCIAWPDTASGVATFEPVGTHPGYRGHRLAGLAMLEALHRLKARGLKWGRVATAHFNTSAHAAYENAGFELFDRTRWWTKTLGA